MFLSVKEKHFSVKTNTLMVCFSQEFFTTVAYAVSQLLTTTVLEFYFDLKYAW